MKTPAFANAFRIEPEVDAALREGRAVVALESAVVTHGLPRTPSDGIPSSLGLEQGVPLHLATARALERTVRAAGAVPATVAVIDGQVRIGLDDASLTRLAEERGALKASVSSLPHAIARTATAGTTVSATLAACHRTARTDATPRPRVLATGGIGGVHRDWTRRLDVSADLGQLATTPMAVVCSGVKAILDIAATLEALEALGVPVAAVGTDHFPRFIAAGADDLTVALRIETADDAARLCRAHWEVAGSRSAVVLAQPAPSSLAVDADAMERAVRAADTAADAQHATGAGRTPFLLAAVARATGGRSIVANVALLLANARLAAGIATALAPATPGVAGFPPDP